MKLLQSILATLIAVLMLFSTTGVRISQHWCGDRLVNATIWGDAEPCTHAKSNGEVECPIHGVMKVGKKCCSEREVIVEGGDENFSSSSFILQAPNAVLIPILYGVVVENVSVETAPKKFYNHSPPLIGPPVYLQVQSFII